MGSGRINCFWQILKIVDQFWGTYRKCLEMESMVWWSPLVRKQSHFYITFDVSLAEREGCTFCPSKEMLLVCVCQPCFPACWAEWNSLSNIRVLLLLFAGSLAFSPSEVFLQENSQVFFPSSFWTKVWISEKKFWIAVKYFLFFIFFFFFFSFSGE